MTTSAAATESHIVLETDNWRPRFFAIWTGQALSLIGSALTNFVLVWWITQTTNSALALAFGSIAAMLPMALLGPLAGTLVDRWNRRTVMIVADLVTTLCILLAIALFASGLVQVWHVYVLMFVRSSMQAFQSPASSASTALMVPKSQLTRVAGLNQMIGGLMSIASAPLGALALGFLPIQGAMMIDVVTAVLGIVPLLFFKIPQPPRQLTGKPIETTVLRDFKDGLRYVLGWRGLVMLLILIAVLTGVLMPAYSLQPLFVKTEFGGGVTEVAWIEGMAGVGMLGGGLLLSLWGGFKRRIVTVLIAASGMAVGQIVTGAAPASMLWLAIFGSFISGVMISLASGPIMAIVQSVVPPDFQGRVNSIFSAASGLAVPVGLLLSGSVAEAAGTRAIYIGGGVIVIVTCAIGLFVPALMGIESEQRQTRIE